MAARSETSKMQASVSPAKQFDETKPKTGLKFDGNEKVADILERQADKLIHDWLTLVERQDDLMAIPLDYQDRTGHLPALLKEVITRLRLPVDERHQPQVTETAGQHGDLRRQQGYSVAMIVEESRLLQVSIFTTLHNNTHRLAFEHLLPDVVVIADEVDAQLKRQMLRYMQADAVAPGPSVN